jgi:predicted membrane-bound spermidine synthase
MSNIDDSRVEAILPKNNIEPAILQRTPGEIDRLRRPHSADIVRGILFLLFFVSGFCSLLYQVVWMRLAFASFGIITPVLSLVLSVFMLGLSLGAWLAGRSIASLVRKTGISAIILYGAAELLIGVGAFAVPALFALGERGLLGAGQTDSIGYLLLSAVVLAVSILPWCVCMGATFPFMMAFVREWDREFAGSFSYLYLANVLGAMSGTLMTAVVLVEAFGFRHTLWIAAIGNFAIAAASMGVAWSRRKTGVSRPEADEPEPEAIQSQPGGLPSREIKWLLFSTGFCSMAMEVVWSRSFTPVLKTQVYSFAAVVFAYLGATFLGSLKYRRDLARNAQCAPANLIALLATAAFLPIVINDPRILRMSVNSAIHLPSVLFLLASIGPLCAVLGYLTPQLVDQYSAGNPRAAGKAYAINVLGCILGPLVASYLLLPCLAERHALVLLSLPFIAFLIFHRRSLKPWMQWGAGLAAGAVLVCTLFISKDFEDWISVNTREARVRRDYAASVTSFGKWRHKGLLVNGIGMTMLTPITKMMVHLPLALLKSKPDSALIICFGMGTSYRSALSWNIDTTAVELVPSVTEMFDYYHADAARLLKQPRSRIVIDDGRRYLRRVSTQYDLITVDPPPPIEAAGSSLLYSREFLELTKQHLRPGGILQIWFPGGEDATEKAVLRTVWEAFPYVRGFLSVESLGIYLLASMDPIDVPAASQLAARLPETARRDLLEWNSTDDVTTYLQKVILNEFSVERSMSPNPDICITDDHPFNEYFLLRRSFLPAQGAKK